MTLRSIFIFLLVVLLLNVPGLGNAQVTYNQAYKTSTSVAELANTVIGMKIQVYSMLTAVKGLTGEFSAESLEAISDELANLVENSNILPEQAKQISILKREYFFSSRNVAEESGVSGNAGQAELEQDFGLLEEDMAGAGQYFEPVIMSLKSVQQMLVADPGAAGTEPVLGLIFNLEREARALYLVLEKLSGRCAQLARATAPEGMDIDELIAEEVEEELGLAEAFERMGEEKITIVEDASAREGSEEKAMLTDIETEAGEGQEGADEELAAGEAFEEIFEATADEEVSAELSDEVADSDAAAAEQEIFDLSPIEEEVFENDDLLSREEALELEPPVEPEPVPEIIWPEEPDEE